MTATTPESLREEGFPPQHSIATQDFLLTHLYTGRTDLAQLVEIVPFAQTSLKLPSRFKRIIKPKRCYNNAYLLAKVLPNIQYCEGEVVIPYGDINGVGLPIQHAWNSINGLHFDLTFELHNDEAVNFRHYCVVSGTLDSLAEQKYKMPSHMDLFTQFINRHPSSFLCRGQK